MLWRLSEFAGNGKRAYLFACALVVVTVLARLYMGASVAAKFPFAPFLAAVLLSAWLFGTGPSYIVLFAGGFASIAIGVRSGLFSPQHTLTWVGLLIYLVLGGGVIALVSRYRSAMAQTKATEDRLHAGLDAAGAATWDMDEQAGTTYWSPGHYRLLGYQVDEVQPSLEAWRRRVHPEDLDRVYARWDECVRQRTNYDCQFRVVWPDGTVRWVEAKGRYTFGTHGEVLRSVGGFIDITERKRAQEALLDAEKLAATGRMAAALAHEINNPLAAVTNLVYLLRNDPELSPSARHYIPMIDGEVQRLANLVRKTLSFYREESRPTPADLGEMMDSIALLYNDRLQEGSIQLEIRNDLNGEVVCHVAEVRQVMTNLFLNAVEAVSPGGRVKVHLYHSCDWSNPRLSGTRVVVADDGPGIPDVDRLRVFEPFFTTKGERGTGLGLWISKGLVEKNGGRIRVRSFAGSRTGTGISVFLPDLAERKASAAPVSAVQEI